MRGLTRDENGTPLTIHFILPPNPVDAVARGKIMVCVEGEWSGGRQPLNGLPLSKTYRCNPEDVGALECLEGFCQGETPGMMQLDREKFASLLGKLINHPRVTLGKSRSLAIDSEPRKVKLDARLEPSGEIKLSIQPQPGLSLCIGGDFAWILEGASAAQIGIPKAYWVLFSGPLIIPRSQVPRFLTQDWPQFQKQSETAANFDPAQFTLETFLPQFHLQLTGGLAQLDARLTCLYGPRSFVSGKIQDESDLFLPDPQSITRYYTRDIGAENAALARLIKSGFSSPNAEGLCRLNGQNGIIHFFAREYPRLQKLWKVDLEERLQKTTDQHFERIEPRFQAAPSGQNWFELEVSYQTDSNEALSAADVQRLVLSGQSGHRLKNGKIGLLDIGAVEEFQEVLRDCSPERQGNVLRISTAQAGFIEASLKDAGGWQLRAPENWRKKLAAQGVDTPLPSLGELEPVLRPYQKIGVGWIRFLRQNGFGGILADEMGLGKTLQTLAFIQMLKTGADSSQNSDAAPGKPVLVVCPTSLVFNWVNETRRFTPQLKVLALSGPNRDRLFKDIPAHDIVITSYALIRRDAELYQSHEFDLMVLDEAQHIKNRQSQNAQSVKSVHARQRLVLTGTPLENSVLDLWSILDFLMPGYLGTAQDFRERYEVPISREKDSAAQARLARRVRPFILRRLKKEVAAELPEKIEQVSYCDLTPTQAGIYRQVLEASRQEIVNAVGEQGLAKSRTVIFTALLRLRQICCDLRLLKLQQEIPADEVSGKIDLFGELMEEILDGGHRVLVFSQFVSMLTLLRERLDSEEVPYCYLDGSTKNREEVVGRFQNSNTIPVFLISLKAGGVGLNLTGADTVIHFDPWWNPAVEAQATDRAHRFGQTRVVTSYKLITRGTIEEKILQLQTKKRELFQAALGTEADLGGVMDWDQIQQLLSD